jgi:hypothetical protein
MSTTVAPRDGESERREFVHVEVLFIMQIVNASKIDIMITV